MRPAHVAIAALLLAMTPVVHARKSRPTPQDAVDDLLAADRGFADASARTNLVSGLTAMFAADVVMPVPGGRFARSREDAAQALRANPDNAGARATWAPVRGGISADARHGFTFGYMTVTSKDGKTIPVKYLAYWVQGTDGWRVAVYKRGRADSAPSAVTPMPPALPPALVPASDDLAAIARFRESLDAAERAFSDEAQTIGIGPAFAKHGRSDAVNMGPPSEPAFIVGSDAIGRNVGTGYPPGSPGVSWAPDSVIVASSGDLGVTIGFIRPNGAPKDPKAPMAFPFFTIWRRDSPTDPWKYVAE